MGALATIPHDAVALALPADIAFEDWLGVGRDLADQKRNIDWLIGDWIHEGRERFGEQLSLALPEIPIEQKMLTRAEKVANAFPPDKRDRALSYQHHAYVADLPEEEARVLLDKAHAEHWTEEQTRKEALKRRAEIGQSSMFTDPDWEQHELASLARAWNRARPSVRDEFLEMIAEAKHGEIDV